MLGVGEPLAATGEQTELIAQHRTAALVVTFARPLLLKPFEIAGQFFGVGPVAAASPWMTVDLRRGIACLDGGLHDRSDHFALLVGVPNVAQYPQIGDVGPATTAISRCSLTARRSETGMPALRSL